MNKNMSEKSNNTKGNVYVWLLLILMAALLICEVWKEDIFGNGNGAEDIYSLVSRAIGGTLCMVLVIYCSYGSILKVRVKGLLRAVLFTLPCWAIAINNFPIIPFLSGEAYINAGIMPILFYALQCLCVGFFEEMAFRGCIFMLVLQKKRKTTADLFWSIVISSAIFGVIHLVNVFVGASIVSVVLQVGYSFLIGGMCSVVLMKTGCLWHCVLLHAVYNFCGGVVPKLGGGTIWSTPEIVLTAVVAVIVTAYVVISLLRIDTSSLDGMFPEKSVEADEDEEDEEKNEAE